MGTLKVSFTVILDECEYPETEELHYLVQKKQIHHLHEHDDTYKEDHHGKHTDDYDDNDVKSLDELLQIFLHIL